MSDHLLEAYLAKLEEQRARLDIQIAGVRAELGLDPSETNGAGLPVAPPVAGGAGGKPIVTGKVRSDEFFRMSIPEAVKRYLEIMKQPQSPTAMVNALKTGGVLSQSKNFYTTVWTALKRLRAAGEIVNTPSGWGLSDWYPNKPKPGTDERKPKKGKKRRKLAQQAVKPGDATSAAAKPVSGYNAFMAEQRKAGRTLKEIGAAWQKKKESGG